MASEIDTEATTGGPVMILMHDAYTPEQLTTISEDLVELQEQDEEHDYSGCGVRHDDHCDELGVWVHCDELAHLMELSGS